mmetsp:Transcript_24910/g.44299  ORF Transcript_24910/g.44299 Transcript_24910/m.44299 type:complete len:103 (+) Transcript_24910:66-374(+)
MHSSNTVLPTCASIADSGSSSTTTSGREYAARAIAKRCFWPPDIVMPRSPTWVMSPARKASKSCCRAHALTHLLYHASSISPPKMMFSFTVSFMQNAVLGER